MIKYIIEAIRKFKLVDIVVPQNIFKELSKLTDYQNIHGFSDVGVFYYDFDNNERFCRIYTDKNGLYEVIDGKIQVWYDYGSSILTDNEHILEDLESLFKLKVFW